MAVYPVSVPVTPDLQNDIDDILAEHQNDPNDEITAIATAIGAIGKSQSWGIDIVSALLNGTPVRIVKKDASTLTAKAGVCWVGNSGQSIRLPRRLTADLDITSGDIDTGSLADDTYYYVYAVADLVGTELEFVFSLSSTAPSGSYTSYELVGWFYNESAGALDVTSGFVGNIKRGLRTSSPNGVKLVGTDDVAYGVNTYADVPNTNLRLVTSGRPVVVQFDAPVYMSDNNTIGVMAINIDGATKISKGQLQGASGDIHGFNLHWFDLDLAAGEHTIKMQWKIPSGEIRNYGATQGNRIISAHEL